VLWSDYQGLKWNESSAALTTERSAAVAQPHGHLDRAALRDDVLADVHLTRVDGLRVRVKFLLTLHVLPFAGYPQR